jgi:FMN reductase
MSRKFVVGLSGNIARPSKTRAFVEHVAEDVAKGIGALHITYDIEDLGQSIFSARRATDLDGRARAVVEELGKASVLVVGSPTYKGSYTGLFKHFFDLLDPSLLRGKPTILLATGGGERHSLIVEHQLRPLFGFFEALTMPTAIYASDKDFAGGVLASSAILDRARQAVNEAVRAVGAEPRGVSLAA